MFNLTEEFKDYPELKTAGESFDNFLTSKGVSANIGLLVREGNYPLLKIEAADSSLRLIGAKLRAQKSCTPEVASAFNLGTCLTRHKDAFLIVGSPQIVTGIARNLTLPTTKAHDVIGNGNDHPSLQKV